MPLASRSPFSKVEKALISSVAMSGAPLPAARVLSSLGKMLAVGIWVML